MKKLPSIALHDIEEYLNRVIEASNTLSSLKFKEIEDEIAKNKDLPLYHQRYISKGLMETLPAKWIRCFFTNRVTPAEALTEKGDPYLQWNDFSYSLNWELLPVEDRPPSDFDVIPHVRAHEVPYLFLSENPIIPIYHIYFQFEGKTHNERFPAFLSVKEGSIIKTGHYLNQNFATFWDIYDQATTQDKKILLRDWLPLEDKDL